MTGHFFEVGMCLYGQNVISRPFPLWCSQSQGKICSILPSRHSRSLTESTERERQLKPGKRTERTELDFRFSICRSAIGRADFFIFARRRHCCHFVFAKSV